MRKSLLKKGALTMNIIKSLFAAALGMILLCGCGASVPEQTTVPVLGTYEDNPYFDIVDTSVIRSADPFTKEPLTVVIHKLYAKESVDIDTELTAYDASGTKLGDSRDFTLPLVQGTYNFLMFPFETVEPVAETKGSYDVCKALERGPEHSVEMIQWIKEDAGLKVAVQQTAGKVGPLARGRFLLCCGDRIIGCARSWFFKDYLQNSGDTAEILADDWSAYFCEEGQSPDSVEMFLNP